MMVQHHVKYKEIHGVDEIAMMTQSEHVRLHQRLRREDKCLVPATELHTISHAAHCRTNKGEMNQRKCRQKRNKLRNCKKNRILFFETVGRNVQLIETVINTPDTGTLFYGSRFYGTNGMKLKIIDI